MTMSNSDARKRQAGEEPSIEDRLLAEITRLRRGINEIADLLNKAVITRPHARDALRQLVRGRR